MPSSFFFIQITAVHYRIAPRGTDDIGATQRETGYEGQENRGNLTN